MFVDFLDKTCEKEATAHKVVSLGIDYTPTPDMLSTGVGVFYCAFLIREEPLIKEMES